MDDDAGRRLVSGPREKPFGRRFVWPLYAGSALNPINSSLIATALVPIAHELRIPIGRTSVLVAALYLASAVAQPTAGKLAVEFGPRRVFLCGSMAVLAGGLLGGVAHNLSTLIVARVIIGIGTSAGYPAAMLMIHRRANAARLDAAPGKVLGGLAIAGTVTIAVGPPIGGLLVGALGWRIAFLVNLPAALAVLGISFAWLPRDEPRRSGRIRDVLSRIDVSGILLFASTMTALLVFLLSLPHPTWTALALAVAGLVGLVAWELRASTPFVDVRQLAANHALTRTYVRASLTLFGLYSILYGLTQWLQAARGMSAAEAGLIILPMGALSVVVTRPISARNLVRAPLIFGAAAMLAASTGVGFISVNTPTALIIVVTLLFGLMLGATVPANQTALYSQAEPAQLGTASGLFRTFSYVGSITSSTVTGIAFGNHVNDAGLHHISLILIGVGVLVLLMSVTDRHLTSRAAGPGSHGVPLRRMTDLKAARDSSDDAVTARLDTRRTALLILNYQPAILRDYPGAGYLVDNTATALAYARAAGVRIVFVRIAFTEQDRQRVPTHRAFAAVGAGTRLADGDPSTDIVAALRPRDSDVVITKSRLSIFAGTELDGAISRNDVDTLVLAGVSTSGVVLAALREAADRGYRTLLLGDCCDDPQPEVQRALMDHVIPSRAEVIDVGDLPSLLGLQAAPAGLGGR